MRKHVDIMLLSKAILNHITGPNGDEVNALTRFTCRMIPIVTLQKANLSDFIKTCIPIIDEAFRCPTLKWCVEFKVSGNDKVIKKEYVDTIRE
jgi:hypothetical protein